MPDAEGRRPRRLKDQRRVPLNLRVTPPQTRGRLESSAQHTGRSLSQQTEFLLEKALLLEAGLEERIALAMVSEAHWNAGPDEKRDVAEIYRAPAPSTELISRLIQLEGRFVALAAAVETALDRNTTELTRAWSRLYRVLAEVEAKIASNTTETSTAVSHLQTVTAHLLAGLKRIDAMRTGRREKADAVPRPRLVSTNGDKSS